MSRVRQKEPQRPLVVVIGFLGSKPRYIQKYADLLASCEVDVAPLTATDSQLTTPDVIQYIPPMETFFTPSKHDVAASALLNRITTALGTPTPIHPPRLRRFRWAKEPKHYIPEKILKNLDGYQPRKVLFFCLSNNGAYGYANLLNFAKRTNPDIYSKLNRQTCGVIWDSSPSLPTVDVFKRGFTSAITSTLGLGTQSDHPVITPIVSTVAQWLLNTDTYKTASENVAYELQHAIPYHAPQLYLVSHVDDLVLAKDTRDYLLNRSKRVKSFFDSLGTMDSLKSNLIASNIPLALSGAPTIDLTSDAPHTIHTSMAIAQKVNNGELLHPAQHAISKHQLDGLYHYHLSQHVLPTINAFYFPAANDDHHLPRFERALKKLELGSSPIHYFLPHHKKDMLTKSSKIHAAQQYEKIKPLFTKTVQFDDYHTHFLYDFHDSGHVQHIRRYPKEYSELVGAFCSYAFRG